LDAYTDRGDYRLSLHQAVADDGLEVSFGPDPVVPGGDAPKALLFTSHEDNITILTIRINRGNCQFHSTTDLQLPKKMRFGGILAVRSFYHGDCIPIEAEVSTDKGDYRFDLSPY